MSQQNESYFLDDHHIDLVMYVCKHEDQGVRWCKRYPVSWICIISWRLELIQGPPTHDGFFEFDILGTLEVVTSHFDSPNFSKHAGIW